MTRSLILSLIADYLRLRPGDASAREAWAQRVREAFPYESDVLTAPIGDHLFRLSPGAEAPATRARTPQEARENADRINHMRTVSRGACGRNEGRVAC